MKSYLKISLPLLLLLVCGFFIYYPALESSFHLDDSPSIRDNVAIRGLSPSQIFAFWPTRFVTYFSLAINYHFSGLNPQAYHATNIAIHIVNALLFYWLVILILQTGSWRQNQNGFHSIALLSSLFFLLHPIQTQAVAYVIQRATSLGTMFYLGAVTLYLRSRQMPKNSPGRILGFQGALLATLLALLTKEFTFSLPLVLLMTEILLREKGEKLPWKRVSIFLLALLVIPFLVWLDRDNPYYNDSGQVEWLQCPDTSKGLGISPVRYLATQEQVFLTYLRLCIFPVNQRVEYDYPWQESPLAPQSIVGLLVGTALIMTGWRWRKISLIGAMGIFWFILTLLPESSLIPISDPAVEHRLYLPLVGVALVMAAWVRSWGRGKLKRIILVGCLGMLGFLTYKRSQVWKTPISLWEDNVVKAEGKARVHGNLGKAYLDAGRYGKAAQEFERMLELDPTYAGAYNNLAVIYIDHQRDDDKAKHYIKKSLELVPEYPSAYLNLGVIEMNNFRWLPAIRNFEKTLELDPNNQTAHYNIAASYFNLGNRLRKEGENLSDSGNQDESEKKLRETQKAFIQAEGYASQGMKIWPSDPRFYQLMGLIQKVMGREKEAKDFFQKARLIKSRQ